MANESAELAEQIGRTAYDLHGDDEAEAKKMIDEIVHGTGTWADSMRGLAWVIYLRLKLKQIA